ncbi:hypothetical protein [Metamycoplasma equirhinis]|uniref:hypothetical protein n=1 Tax=Metamycoplasma equirhinis TaxID=92402 RepID=UPI001476C5AF|nr:hypothetical protein [Metamycoplasma equirhinis]
MSNQVRQKREIMKLSNENKIYKINLQYFLAFYDFCMLRFKILQNQRQTKI